MTAPVDVTAARQAAADLFAAAARRGELSTAARLDCLAAQHTLALPSRPVPGRFDVLVADELITRALLILAGLTPHDFADPAVVCAARHGRRALRGAR